MSNKNCPPKKSCHCNDAGEVIYTGLDLPCIPAETGDNLNEIFTAIDAKLCDLIACCAESTFTTNDTPSIDLTGDGTPGSPLMADAIISPQEGNTLVILPDGLFTSGNGGGGTGSNELVYGGIVTWSGIGYTYDVTAAGYFINGIFYTSPATQITLNAADPTFDRFDAFVVTDAGLAIKITGDPSADPLQPSIDPATQLALTYVLVQAGTLTPAQDECLYQEGIEWTAFSSTVRIVVNDPSDPYSGLSSIEGTAVEHGDFFTLTRGSTTEPFAYNKLSFKLKSYGSWGDNSLNIQFYNGVTPVGSPVPILSGSFGFDDNQTLTYQNIDIPISSFGIASQQDVDRIRFTAQNPTLGTFDWNIDDICLLVSPYVSPPFVNLIFQSGLKRVGNVVELGIDWGGYANPNVGPFESYLQHNTAIHTFAHTLYHTGFPVWKPITETYQQQTFGIATDIATFLSSGTVKTTEPDYQNRVRLHLGYTGQNYQDDDILWGYMQDRIGYWIGTNLFGAGSFGIQLDDKDSKTTGIFMHTYDTGDDAVTIFGAPINATGILHDQPLTVTGENLIKDRIAIFKTDKDIRFLGYPNTRDDGDASRFLTTDIDGNLELRDFDFGGIGVLLTANNGLYKNVPTNVRWGGPLVEATTITGNGFDITFNGVNSEFLLTDIRFEMDLGQNVVSANNLTLGNDGNVFIITGNTQINAITNTNWKAGSVIYLLFNGAAKTVKHNTAGGAGTSPILLAGSVDLITDNFTVLTLVYNGTQWEETSRKFSTTVGSYVFQNALTESPVGVTEWGGTLLHNTTVAQGGFDSIFSTGRVLMTNARFETDLGAEIAAANDLTLGSDGNVFPISGATQINAITTTNWQAGSEVILEFVSTPTIKHNTAGGAGTAPIFLAGGVDYVAAANDILHLVYDGISWHEVSRKIAAVAPFTGISADNGLTENVPNNVQWGGTLLQDTTIIGSGFFSRFTNNTGVATLQGINTSTGIAINGTAATNTAVAGTSTDGNGVDGFSTNGSGITGTSTNLYAGTFFSNPASTNTVHNVLLVRRGTSGTGANGIGAGVLFEVETDATILESNRIISKWTDAVTASATSQMVITGVNSGTPVDKILIGGAATQMFATRFETYKGSDVISAGDLVLNTDGNIFDIVAGAAQINAITTTDWQAGSFVILKFETSATVKHNTAGGAGTAPMFLAGAVDYEASTNDILFLEYDGTNWHEVSRKLAAVAPFTGITADNGLTENVANNVQLGGTLLQNTTINTTASFTLSVTGSTTNPLSVTSTTAPTISATASSSGTAINASSSSGIAVYGFSTSGIGVQGQALTGEAGGRFNSSFAGTNNIANVLEVARGGNGNSANGFGAAIEYELETSPGFSGATSNRIISKWTDALTASRTSQLLIEGVNSTTATDIMCANGAGNVGIGIFSGLTGTRLEVVDNSVAGASVIKVTSTSTAATGNNQKLIEAVLSGANANTTQTTSAIFGSNSHTGTNATNFGVRGEVTNGTISGAGVYGIAAADQSGVLGLSVTGNGVAGSSTSGSGGAFTSSSGSGVNATSTSSYGLVSFSSTGESANFQINPASTNTLATVARFTRLSSGTPAAGIGSQIAFHPETDTTSANPAAHIGAYWTDVANGTRTGDLAIYTTNSAVSGLALTVTSDKKIVTTGRVLGTQGADVASVAGAIALTAGNVFEVTGTNTITLISNVGWQNGSEITLVFTSTAAVASGTATSGTDITIILAGGATFNGSADDTLTLILCEVGGTQAWREKCRSVN